MLTLAVAIGIGRFAFTPILPMMQKDVGLSLAAGGWLASANYVGYLIGAVSAIWLRVAGATMVRVALAAIVLLTALMGVSNDLGAWLLLRGLAGIASAWALIFGSAWVLQALAASGSSRLGGRVFGGVGLGITIAGGACLVFADLAWSSDRAWIALGAIALLLSAVSWPVYRTAHTAPSRTDAWDPSPGNTGALRRQLYLVLCYGLFGFGYIVPATFLPVMAKRAIDDPAIFGWAWPIFGVAALLSTLAAGRLSALLSNRTIWATGHVVMAIGVAVPVFSPGITGIVISALCVGGTFMVVTFAGMQEAHRVAPSGSASLMAAMTAAFATGQILGPMLVSVIASERRGLTVALVAASGLLLLSALALLISGAIDRRR